MSGYKTEQTKTTRYSRNDMVDALVYAMKSWPPKPINIFEDWYPWRIYRRWKRKRGLEKMSKGFGSFLSTPNKKWFSL